MLPEDNNNLLRQIISQGEENNRLLRKLVNAQRWATFWIILRWVVVLGSVLGLYYYLQPFLDNFLDSYSSIINSLPNF